MVEQLGDRGHCGHLACGSMVYQSRKARCRNGLCGEKLESQSFRSSGVGDYVANVNT